MSEKTRAAEMFYGRAVPKPVRKGRVDELGWLALPGGGSIKVGRQVIGSFVVDIGAGAATGPERPADRLYGKDRT